MTELDMVGATIRPIILAGGLGTRLRPRTNFVPKPLLPVRGRPILWYALHNLQDYGLLPPIVTLDYKGDLIRSFFGNNGIDFRDLPGCTMAETVLQVAEGDSAEAFLGMSSDVLIPPHAIKEIIQDYVANGHRDTVLFVKLPQVGHKKWEFLVASNMLEDIIVRDVQTQFERVLLLLTKTSLEQVRAMLGNPVFEDGLPEKLRPFQTGWILLLKSMIHNGIRVSARIVDIPVCNINVPTDFETAEQFAAQYWGG